MEAGGFADASEIKANTPYIICMPNNERYVESYRIYGTVTFSATNVEIPVTAPVTNSSTSESLVANFQCPSSYANIFAINDDGSLFVRGLRQVRPFEAYATSRSNTRTIISIGDDNATGIKDIISSLADDDPEATIRVYSTAGILLKQGKRSEVMQMLPKGVYIINGKKFIK